jgi:hypothetical protein
MYVPESIGTYPTPVVAEQFSNVQLFLPELGPPGHARRRIILFDLIFESLKISLYALILIGGLKDGVS